jgi:DNA-binding MarR family transcriptional regulator
MSKCFEKRYREIFETFINLSREIRCCCREEAICRNVTFQQFVILDAVVKSEGLDLADLHKILSVEKSTTTRLVNPLLRKGFLTRDKTEHDSRAVKLNLTEEGMEIHRKVWICMEGFIENLSQNIPEDRQEAVLEAVKMFTEAMRKAAAECRGCK